MAGQSPRVIPGVPLAALENIADPHVRDVLRALVDGWHVRNGNAGTGDEQFVTRKDLGLSPKTAGNGGFSNNLALGNTTFITPFQLTQAITSLQADVIESPLFKALGERIELVDAPGGLFSRVGAAEVAIVDESKNRITADAAEATARTALGVRVGANEAAISSETTLRTNSDNALAQAVNYLWATVGNNTGLVQSGTKITANTVGAVATSWNLTQAAIKDANGNYVSTAAVKQTADAAASATGDLKAQWTVKTDINGYVAGFGLASTANNSTPFSEFIVRADRFAIGSPSGPGITPQVPFIVTTTNKVLGDGTVLPPGVYMDKAFVKELFGAYIEAGFFKAANIYTGSTLVDITSKLPVSSVAAGSWQGSADMEASVVRTDPSLRFYGPNWHPQSDVYHRVRATPDDNHRLIFTINITATIDNFLSIWYRYNGGSWIWLGKTVEPQTDFGTASVARVVTLPLTNAGYIEFGLSVTDENMIVFNAQDAKNHYIRDWSMNVSCVNL